LIGLEVLVAATIIRTILSWSTVLEMTGRWPWQKAPAPQKGGRHWRHWRTRHMVPGGSILKEE
jgi:hypothetical protein